MQIHDTGLRDIKILEPKQHGDARGWFAEVFNAEMFRRAGLPAEFAQDKTTRGVLSRRRTVHCVERCDAGQRVAAGGAGGHSAGGLGQGRQRRPIRGRRAALNLPYRCMALAIRGRVILRTRQPGRPRPVYVH